MKKIFYDFEDCEGNKTKGFVEVPEVLQGYEGHTKERMCYFEEVKTFIGNCIANKKGLEMDDLTNWIEQ